MINYLLITIFIIIIIICLFLLYIKIKYRFWALQPVFHIYDLNYYLSDLMLIESVPAINEPASYDAEANIDSDFISKFANAKKALGDVKQFTIKDELNSENMKDLVIVIGDGNGYANKIKFKTPCESMFGLNEIPFPADVA